MAQAIAPYCSGVVVLMVSEPFIPWQGGGWTTTEARWSIPLDFGPQLFFLLT